MDKSAQATGESGKAESVLLLADESVDLVDRRVAIET